MMVPDAAVHREDEHIVGYEGLEAVVAAVAGERDQHRGQGDGDGEALGDLDVDGEQQHDRGINSSPMMVREGAGWYAGRGGQCGSRQAPRR